MNMREPWSLDVTEETATIRWAQASEATVAGVLGVERDESGQITRAVLDRRVHAPGQRDFAGWQARGAVTTELTRQAADGEESIQEKV
jgi:hypothetical protein